MTAKVTELLREAVSGKGPESFVLTRGAEPVASIRDAWQNLCVRAGLGAFVCCACERAVTKRKKCECGGWKRKYHGLIPHDLRRSAAKALRSAGVPESVVMAMGGWKTPAMFRRYAIVSSSDQRAAVEALEKSRTAQPVSNASKAPLNSPARVLVHAKLQ